MSSEPIPTEAASTRPPLEAALYLVATPIGNLRDITLRALDVLAGAALIAAEDTRVARKLLSAHGVAAPRLMAYHEHNAAAQEGAVLAALAAGQAVALISDAGTPLVSDPGARLVLGAITAGHRVIPVPGACAALAGLSVAGLPSGQFFFAGFAPAKGGQRRGFLAGLADVPATLIFYESGPRLAESLTDMAEAFGDRPAAVARELTKLFEEVRRDRLPALAAAYAEAPPPRGEIVVLVGPPPPPKAADDAAMKALLLGLLADHSVKEAAAIAAERLAAPRKRAYAAALALKAKQESAE
jgi:16S rRNA (cytidine1402-2'-O)-methyltransferase